MARLSKTQDRLKEGKIRLKGLWPRYIPVEKISSIEVGGGGFWGKYGDIYDVYKHSWNLSQGLVRTNSDKVFKIGDIRCIEKNPYDCFVASTVYGSSAPQTNAFREIRDGDLRQNPLGAAFVWAYYHGLGKGISYVLERNPKLVPAVRRTLDKLVAKHIQ
jgi:hypothetical protein